ncbi:MAG: regulator of protease activity HflC (stomatin/prohibitin superfamily) [Planctomycetota bacterium]
MSERSRNLLRLKLAPQEPAEEEESPKRWWQFLVYIFDAVKDDLFVVFAATAAAIVRAMGVTIRTGTTGLRFTLGRASKELAPGFHPLFPGLQSVKRIPTRSRTMDLPSQRVVNTDGLVYYSDANIVYRVIDVRRALIEIDDLEKGMRQMLTMGVQEVLRATDRHTISDTAALSEALLRNLEHRLEPWGVAVERAGFPSIGPSPRTLRITQLAKKVEERERTRDYLASSGVAAGMDLGLVGTRRMPRSRAKRAIAREQHQRRFKRLLKLLQTRGWSTVEIKQAELSLLSRVSTRGRMHAGG